MTDGTSARTGWPRWLKIVLWLAAVLVGLVLLAFAALYVSLSGGLDNVLDWSTPEPDDPEVVSARTQARQVLEQRADGFLDGPIASVLGPPRVIAHGTDDECERGQHNWKIDDPYDLRCEMSLTRLIEAQLPSFRADMLALHDRLTSEGWTEYNNNGGLRSVIRDYWDQNAGPMPDSPSGDDRYTPTDLPKQWYRRPDDRDRSVMFDWVDGTTAGPRNPLELGYADTYVNEDGDPVNGDQLARSLRDGRYALVMTWSTVYFRE